MWRVQLFRLAYQYSRDHLFGRRLLAFTCAALLLAPIAVYVGVQDAERREADHRALVDQRRKARESNRGVTGRDLEPGLRALREPAPAGVLVRGVSDSSPAYWDFGPSGLSTGHPVEAHGSVYEAATAIDLEVLFRVLLGLLALSLGAESVGRERETGTLKHLLALPIPPRLVAIARILAGAGSVVLVTLGLSFVAIASIALIDPSRMSLDLAQTTAFVALATAIYGTAMFSAGVLVAALIRSVASALLASLLLWLTVAVVSPPVLAFAGRLAGSGSSRAVFEAARDSVYDARDVDLQKAVGARLRGLIGPLQNTRTLAFDGELRAAVEETWLQGMAMIRQHLDAIDRENADRMNRQGRVTEAARFVSPGTLMLTVAADLTGTGQSAARRRLAAIEQHQNRLERQLFDVRPWITLRVPGPRGETLEVFERGPLVGIEELPQFQAPPMDLRARLGDATPALVGLALWAIGLSVAGVIAFRDGR